MTEKELIRNFYDEVFHLQNRSTLEYIVNVSFMKKLKKNEVFLWYGDRQEILYFVYSGIIMSSHHRDDSETDFIECIEMEKGRPFLLSNEIKEDIISTSVATALQDSILVCIPMKEIIGLIQHDKEIQLIYVHLLSEFISYHAGLRNVLVMDGIDKVKWYKKKYDKYVGVIPKKVAAAYLNVTPSTYSKLLKKWRFK